MPGGRFAQRNWYIAAFADVTIAVCGGPRSGTRHTVMAALTFRRPVGVFAPEQGEQGALSRRVLDGDCGVVIDEHTTLQTLLSLPAIDGARARFDKHILGPLAGQPSLPLVPLASPSPLIRLLQTRGALTIDEAATALQQSVRELMVDVATLELDGALRKEGALLSLSQ